MIYSKRKIKLMLLNNGIEATKETLINDLIREKYSQSEVEAINSNYLQYLTDGLNEAHKDEWLVFNSFRKQVKYEVKKLIEEVSQNDKIKKVKE